MSSITASYAPTSFFRPRRPQRRRSSSTSQSSATSAATSSYLSTGSESTSEDSSDDDDESDTDSDGSFGGGASGEGLERASGLMSGAGSMSRCRTPGVAQPSTQHSRTHLKLSLALLRVRQALATASYESLAAALRALSSALPTTTTGMENVGGVFLPILDRLTRNLEEELGDAAKGKEYRRALGKEDAKALVGLRQRWTGVAATPEGKGKGKAKESELDWVTIVRNLVAANPSPAFMSSPHSPATSALLTSLEALLLPSSLPRLTLANLGLSSTQLADLETLNRAEEVLQWYLSFEPAAAPRREGRPSAKEILQSVRSLDLSKNRLTTLPSTLPTLLPGLETLSLSNNSCRYLPPCLTLFAQLRRLKTHGNQLARRGKTKLPRRRREEGVNEGWDWQKEGPVRSNTREVVKLVRDRMDAWRVAEGAGEEAGGAQVESLLDIALQVARAGLPELWHTTAGEPGLRKAATDEREDDSPSAPSPSLSAAFDPPPLDLASILPPTLHSALVDSYTCASCRTFTSPLSTTLISLWLPPLYERVHHLDPGISLPTQIIRPTGPPAPPPPSSLRTDVPRPSPHHLTLEERVLLALYGRNTELQTIVVGHEEAHRFCLRCAVGHLGLLGEEGEKCGLGRECRCEVCAEESRVKGEPMVGEERSVREREGVMRWLRRKAGRRRSPVVV